MQRFTKTLTLLLALVSATFQSRAVTYSMEGMALSPIKTYSRDITTCDFCNEPVDVDPLTGKYHCGHCGYAGEAMGSETPVDGGEWMLLGMVAVFAGHTLRKKRIVKPNTL